MPWSPKKKPPGDRSRTWTTLNISWDTYDHLIKMRERGESMNTVVRKALGLTIPDPTRPNPRRSYYDEDWRAG